MKHKKTTTLLMTLALLLVPMMALASSKVTKDFKINAFSAVRASQGINIVFTQAANPGIARVETNSELAPYIIVKVENKCLVARYDFPTGYRQKNTKGMQTTVRVSSPELNSITLSSGADFTSTNTLKDSGSVRINVSSGSDVNMPGIDCGHISLNASSGADIKITDVTASVTANTSSGSDIVITTVKGDFKGNASSAGDLKLGSVNGETISVNASSGSDIVISVGTARTISANGSSSGDIKISGISSESVNATASSGSDINLSGKTGWVNVRTSSGGSVKTRDLTQSQSSASTVKDSKTKVKVKKNNFRQP